MKEGKLTEEEKEEMCTVGSFHHGVGDIVIWIGPNKNSVVKVSNIENDVSGNDCFNISLKDFKIYGNRNKNLITDDILNRILFFIRTNYTNIINFTNNEYRTGTFARKVIKT